MCGFRVIFPFWGALLYGGTELIELSKDITKEHIHTCSNAYKFKLLALCSTPSTSVIKLFNSGIKLKFLL